MNKRKQIDIFGFIEFGKTNKGLLELIITELNENKYDLFTVRKMFDNKLSDLEPRIVNVIMNKYDVVNEGNFIRVCLALCDGLGDFEELCDELSDFEESCDNHIISLKKALSKIKSEITEKKYMTLLKDIVYTTKLIHHISLKFLEFILQEIDEKFINPNFLIEIGTIPNSLILIALNKKAIQLNVPIKIEIKKILTLNKIIFEMINFDFSDYVLSDLQSVIENGNIELFTEWIKFIKLNVNDKNNRLLDDVVSYCHRFQNIKFFAVILQLYGTITNFNLSDLNDLSSSEIHSKQFGEYINNLAVSLKYELIQSLFKKIKNSETHLIVFMSILQIMILPENLKYFSFLHSALLEKANMPIFNYDNFKIFLSKIDTSKYVSGNDYTLKNKLFVQLVLLVNTFNKNNDLAELFKNLTSKLT